ncbi:transposable element Tc3 transposase [Trichonephila clavipes]|nr:transposable element Tc3 transposase [Trichonephila clavipes]
MEDSELWRAVGCIEAGQSITDVAIFFSVHHSVISRLWKRFQTTQTVVRYPADIVNDYLESEGIARMAWPAYSPDLNPIENFWDALNRAVSSRFPPPAALIELETALQEEW